MLPRRHDVAHLIQAENRHLGIIVDEAVDAPCLRELRRQIEEGEKHGLFSLRHGIVADGACHMGLPNAARADEDEITRLFEPVRLHELHDLLFRHLRIEGPVKIRKELHPLDPRHAKEVLPLLLFPEIVFPGQEPYEELPLFRRVAFQVGQKPEVPPQLIQVHRSRQAPSFRKRYPIRMCSADRRPPPPVLSARGGSRCILAYGC